MADVVRSENDLPSLRITLGRTARSRVEFTAVRGRRPAFDVTGCSAAQIGPPLGSAWRHPMSGGAQGRPEDALYELPPDVENGLRAALEDLGPSPMPPDNAIWLELPSPRGYLYLLPWERLLAGLGRPVLRLPNHTVRPQAPSAVLQVAICGSSPAGSLSFDAAGEVARAASMWLERTRFEVRLHLFTDAAQTAELRKMAAVLGPHVVVHDPSEAMAADPPRRYGTSDVVAHPWLRWVAAATGGRALDALHVVAPGEQTDERGELVLTAEPTGRGRRGAGSQLVAAAELSTFLSRYGAWCLVLSGPVGGGTPSALRELADSMAQVHPGVAIAHDGSVDPSGAQLGALLGMVLGDDEVRTAMPAVTCWVHPRFVERPVGPQGGDVSDEEAPPMVQQATAEVLSQESTPTWVASGTRYLESLQTRWLPERDDEPADDDALAALRSVSDLLEKHSRRHLSGGAR